MKVRDRIRRQASNSNYITLIVTLVFATAVMVLAFAEALSWLWIPAIICTAGWFIGQRFACPKCPFCNYISSSVTHGIVGNFCENCGESFDRELADKKG